jgi:hypothetical protein
MAINDILRLYYGARCIFAHGDPTPTLTEGCLHSFPIRGTAEWGTYIQEGRWREFILFYDKLKKDATVSYLQLCMIYMYRFFLRLSNRVMISIAMANQQDFYEAAKALELWKILSRETWPPHRDRARKERKIQTIWRTVRHWPNHSHCSQTRYWGMLLSVYQVHTSSLDIPSLEEA